MTLVKRSKLAADKPPPRGDKPTVPERPAKLRAPAKHLTAIERIAAATEELASGLTEAAAATKELGRSMEQIASGAEEAAGASHEDRVPGRGV